MIGEDHDTVLQRLGPRESQGCLLARTEEQPPGAYDERVDPQPELIEQMVCQQRLAEEAVTVDN